jgi:hypothetical protein
MAGESVKPEGKYIALQIIGGIVLVYVIYVLAIFVLNTDRLHIAKQQDKAQKSVVPILDGFAETSQLQNMTFSTQIPQSDNYLPISPSVNMKGGAQFSYSMWLYVGSPSDAVNKCIFIKGDPKKYTYRVTDNVLRGDTSVTDYVAFCPMISFGEQPLEFTIKFNTMKRIGETLHVKRLQTEQSVFRRNMLSLLSSKFFMLTVVFEDNMPINDFETGILVKVYINDTLYATGRYNDTLKQNNGNLVLFPDANAIPNCKISDLVYYNYALSDADVVRLASKGPNPKPAAQVSKSFNMSYMLSDANRLDISNT